MNRFTEATVSHLEFWKSDHWPLLLDSSPFLGMTNQCDGNPRRHFQFEECWAEKDGCTAIVQQAWSVGGECQDMRDLLSKIQGCTIRLNRWNSVNMMHLKNDIAKL